MSHIHLRYLPIAALLVFVIASAGPGAPKAAGAGPEATATPGTGFSIVGVRNTLKGVPVVVVNGHLNYAIVDGEMCSRPTPDEVFETIVNTAPWPWGDQPVCYATGVPVQICLNPQLGFCSEEFIFDGEDVIADIDWSYFPDVLELPAVTVRFGHGGVVQPVTLLAWYFEAHGVNCSAGETYPAVLAEFVNVWTVGATACGVQGADISLTVTTEEFGELEGSFTWPGEDVTVEVDTGMLLSTPSPAPTPTPMGSGPASAPANTPAMPAALPEAGGPPAPDTHKPIVGLALVSAIAAAIVAGACHRRADRL